MADSGGGAGILGVLVGVMLVIFVVAAPEGILGLVKRWRRSSK